MKYLITSQRNILVISVLLGLVALSATFLQKYDKMLFGANPHRQADTLFTAYSYCFEETNFLLPKVVGRADTNGVSIGEFPLFSYLLSFACKISNQWDESQIRILIVIFYFVLVLVWTWVFIKLIDIPKTMAYIPCLLLAFNFLWLKYLIPPYPDSLALFFIAISFLFYPASEKVRFYRMRFFITVLLFGLGFAIRPYLLPLILISGRTSLISVTILVCVAIYASWYRVWAHRVSDLYYYAIHLRPWSEILTSLPKGLGMSAFQVPKLHLNFITAPLLFFGFLRYRPFLIYWAISVAIVHFAVAAHYVEHEYYLHATNLIGLICVVKVLLSAKYRDIIIAAYVITGSAMTIYHWEYPPIENWNTIRYKVMANTAPTEKIAVFAEGGPAYLYVTERLGSFYDKGSFERVGCPQWADWALIKDAGKAELVHCNSVSPGKDRIPLFEGF